ncbi:adenosylmethionine-8-amino-7-oxononanoate transaminase [Batrachochytrium salamandrivorans]|nr:adenosylmethionine-8-amino-7-oxononanoate transaminase [Batrachochytrium salamandrivorans]
MHQALLKRSLAEFDSAHVIHPYGKLNDNTTTVLPEVVSAKGSKFTLVSGKEIVDGLSSWWACAHGYRRREIDEAVTRQLQTSMSHVMFGGLTHRPACELTARLLDLVPRHADKEKSNLNLTKVFLCDSGSIAVEVAMKIALQYWVANNQPNRNRFLTTRSGYHGDTFLPMSVSDPQNGMHHLFTGVLLGQVFVDSLTTQSESKVLEQIELELQTNQTIAGFIIEPLFQGAGAMHMYSPEFLQSVRKLCTKYHVPMLVDEIATGFGRTGKMFACDHAEVVPDLMMVGKALTGGVVTMGATLVAAWLANGLRDLPLMHGPTFMGNPLACAAGVASLDLFASEPWEKRALDMEQVLKRELLPLASKYPDTVKGARVLGAIGVIEFHDTLTVEMKNAITNLVVDEHHVWLRPFAQYLYTMPPFNAPMEESEVMQICEAIAASVRLMEQMLANSTKRAKKTEDPVTFV